MVSTALRVTGTVAGSGTIRGEEYNIIDIAGSKKDSEYDVSSMMSMQSAKLLLTLALTQGSACSSLLRRPLFSSPFTLS